MERRQVLCGLAGAGIIAAALAACSDDDSTQKDSQPKTKATKDASGQTVLAATSAISVGSGLVVATPSGNPVVVVQPNAGEYKAFDARCTHQGTTIGAPKDNVMVCPNHGSEFSSTDGSVVHEPATRPLAEVAIKVEGGNVILA